MTTFEGQTAIVTGAAQGIGAAIAERLGAFGAKRGTTRQSGGARRPSDGEEGVRARALSQSSLAGLPPEG